MARKDCTEMQALVAEAIKDIVAETKSPSLDKALEILNRRTEVDKGVDAFDRRSAVEAIEAFERAPVKKAVVKAKKAFRKIVSEVRKEVGVSRAIGEAMTRIVEGKEPLTKANKARITSEAVKSLNKELTKLKKLEKDINKVKKLSKKILDLDFEKAKKTVEQEHKVIKELKKELGTLEVLDRKQKALEKLLADPTGESLSAKDPKRQREVDSRVKEIDSKLAELNKQRNMEKRRDKLKEELETGVKPSRPEVEKKEVSDAIKAIKEETKGVEVKIAERKRIVQLEMKINDMDFADKKKTPVERSKKESDLKKEFSVLKEVEKLDSRIEELSVGSPENLPTKEKVELDRRIKTRREKIKEIKKLQDLERKGKELQDQLDKDRFPEPADSPEVELSEAVEKAIDKNKKLKERISDRKRVIELERKIAERDVSKANKEIRDRGQKIKDLESDFSDIKRQEQIKDKIAELEALKEKGVYDQPKTKKESEVSKDLADLISRKEKIIKEMDVRNEIEILKNLLEKKAFDPPKETVERQEKFAEELGDVIYERDKLRREVNSEIEALKEKGFVKKAIEIGNFLRIFGPNFDLNPVFRQGMKLAMSNPIMTAKNAYLGTKSIFSDESLKQAKKRLAENPYAKEADIGKVEFTKTDGEFNKTEEAFRVAWVKKLKIGKKILEASGRGFTAYMNMMRMDLFNAMLVNGFNGKANKVELRSIGKFVNQATGRGSIATSLRGIEDLGNLVFFSFRNQISNIQFMTGQALWAPAKRLRQAKKEGFNEGIASEKKILKAIGVQYGKYILANTVMFATLAAFKDQFGIELELNPLSSDFGKAKDKESELRVDLTSGMASYITLASRIAALSIKNSKTGNTKSIHPDDMRFGQTDAERLTLDFIRRKQSPISDVFTQAFFRKDSMGKRSTIAGTLDSVTTPFIVADAIEAIKEANLPKATTAIAFALFGASMSVHGDGKRTGAATYVLNKLRSEGYISTEFHKLMVGSEKKRAAKKKKKRTKISQSPKDF